MFRNVSRIARDVWGAYERQLQVNPLQTQMLSSTVLWGIGDVLAQTVGEQQQLDAIDKKRAVITAAFGTCFVGPVGHFWYLGLDEACKRLAPVGSTRFIAYKVALDTAILGPAYIAAFLGWGCAFIDGGGLQEYGDKMAADFPSLLAASLTIWPLFQTANFRLVPVRHQLLAVNGMTLLDASFLAWARNQEDWLGSLLAAMK